MSNIITLKAQKRDTNEKLSVLRAENIVPCVVYGGEAENTAIQVHNSDLIRAYRAAGGSTLISLDMEGTLIDVLIHDFQKDPVKENFLHVDFYAITRGQVVTTNIRLSFVGDSEAVKNGGTLEELLKEVEVTVLPRNLIEHLDVDLSVMKEFGDVIRVKDLDLDPEKYTLSNDPEDPVALVSEPRKATTEVEEAPEATEVPVVGKEEAPEA